MGKQFRETRQRSAIRKVLQESDRPLQPKEIRKLAADKLATLGIATVYRNLKSMVAHGEIEQIVLPGQKTCYIMPRKSKKPILVCQNSNRIDLLEDIEIDLPVPELPKDFTLHHYEVIYYGEFNTSTAKEKGTKKLSKNE